MAEFIDRKLRAGQITYSLNYAKKNKKRNNVYELACITGALWANEAKAAFWAKLETSAALFFLLPTSRASRKM